MQPYKKLRRSRLKSIRTHSLVVATISAVFSYMNGHNVFESPVDLFFNLGTSFILGLCIPAVIMSLEFFVFNSRRIRMMSSLLVLLIKIMSYLMAGTLVYFILGLIVFPEHVLEPVIMLNTILYLSFFSLVINMGVFFVKFMGADFLKAYLLSRYHTATIRKTIFMFIDLKDSTSLGEQLQAKEFFHCLNDYIFLCEEVIKYHRGSIYKYLGDGMIVVWEANPDNFRNASRCAVELQRHIRLNSSHFSTYYKLELSFSIGLHTGDAAVGEIGFERAEIGYLSDAVNTAQRIQDQNKILKTVCLASREFLRGLPLDEREEILRNSRARKYQGIKLKGKSRAMTLFSLPG
ncbi:adenylate/guanylate cyclase domain-containing protein [Spirochaeta dissipatitropha]